MESETIVIIAVSAILLFALIAAGLKLYTKNQSKNTVLLLGTCDAGKTSLYTLLRFDEKRHTVSSMKENEGKLEISNKTFDLVDLPGHERVRFRYIDFLPVTKSIVFVVDSTTVNRQIRSVTEYLYAVLANPQVQKNKIPVLIACNKSDMITALPTDKIKLMLEGEINRLRATRTARVVEQQSEGDEGEIFLGYEGEEFKLEHIDNQIEFISCSVENKRVEEIQDWIRC